MIRSWCWGVRWQGQSNRRSYGSHWERRVKCTGIIVIRMVPIGQYVICYLLFIAPGPVICTNMTPSYKIINSITQLYVYTWNNRVVIILGGERMDTDMTTNSRRRLTIHHHHHPTCQPLFSFRCTYQHNQSGTPCHAIPRHHPFTTIDLIWFDLIQPSSPTPTNPNSSTVIHSQQWWQWQSPPPPPPPVTTDDDTDNDTPTDNTDDNN